MSAKYRRTKVVRPAIPVLGSLITHIRPIKGARREVGVAGWMVA